MSVRSRVVLVALGILLGATIFEMALRLVEIPSTSLGADLAAARAGGKMYYIYTKTGLGKCYPTDPRGYLPHDLNAGDGDQQFAASIDIVAGYPDDWTIAKKIATLRKEAPYCSNIELSLLNAGPDRGRPRSVLIVGDSFAFGEGLRLKDTIGFRLADAYPDVNFSNMAWPGASLATVYDVSGPLGSTEVVLYLYNINDLLKTDEFLHRRDALHDELRRWRTDRARGVAGEGVCGMSAICRMLSARWLDVERSASTVDYYRDLYFSRANEVRRQESFDKLQSMNDVVVKRGVRFVVAMFPLFYKAPFAEYPFREIHELMVAECARRGIEFIDLLAAYDDRVFWRELTVHPLDRHPSPIAVELAAEFLKQRLRLD